MLLPIRPICPANKTRRDGTSIIFIQYCKSESEKTLLNTGIAIPPRYWNKKLGRISDDLPRGHGDPDTLNRELHRLVRIAEDMIGHAIGNGHADPVGFVKGNFSPAFDVATLETPKPHLRAGEKKKADFFEEMGKYISSKEGNVTRGTIDMLKNLSRVLKSFEEARKRKISFAEIGHDFYEELVHYLTFEHVHLKRRGTIRGMKVNTVGKNIKQLIIFLKNRRAKKIIPEIDLTGFKIMEEDVDAIYLSPEEIDKINGLDLSQYPELDRHRNLFVFGCLTGLRFSDFSVIRPEDFRDGMIYKKQGKTKHWVVIPLRDSAQRIFTGAFNHNIPVTNNPRFNRDIKEIGRLACVDIIIKHSCMKGGREVTEARPKYAWITSHTCRRSFCTNEFLAGTPVELIMKISGHKSLKDFYRYIKIAPEQAGHRIREIWQVRGEIKILS